MDKTYAEESGHAPFDWNSFLARAMSDGVSADEHVRVSSYAQFWTTCACGNQCAIIPRDSKGAPFDLDLMKLGADFAAYVGTACWNAATETLAKIEQRSAELIAIELAKLNHAR